MARQQSAREGVGDASDASLGRNLIEDGRKGDDAQAGPDSQCGRTAQCMVCPDDVLAQGHGGSDQMAYILTSTLELRAL